MEKVLVTEGSDFIGVRLVDYLDDIGYQVANIDSQPPTELKDAVRETVLWCTWYSRLKANRSNKQYDFDIK